MRPKPPQNNENWFCYFAYFSAVTPLQTSPFFSCLPYTLPSAHRLLARSVVAPPVVVCHGEGERKGNRRLLAKDVGFLLPVLLLLYLFGSSKSRRGVHISASFAVLRIACALLRPQSPSCPEPTPSWHPLRGIRVRLSFHSCLS